MSRFRAATGADFDGDGDNDVVVSAAVSAAGIDGTPAAGTLFMNEGGRFVDRTTAFLPQLATPQVRWWSVAADFAGPAGPPDGLVDLFVAGGQGESSRLFMNRGRDIGNGNFLGFEDASSRLVNSPITGITHSYTARSGDFNGDGLADLLVFQYKSNSQVGPCSAPYASNCYGQSRLLINSNGTLVDETATRLPARNEPSLFGQVGDFNGDGHADIALVNLKNGLVPQVPASVPSVRVLINDGTGHFQTGEQLMPERLVPQSGFGTYSLDVGDFNKDGRLDIFVINWGSSGDEARDGVLLNIGSGNQLFPGGPSGLAYPIINAALDDDGDHPTAADLDGDGDVDLVVAQFATRPYFLMNESRGGPMVLRESTPAAPIVPNTIGFRNMVFDANADGVLDVWLALRNQNFLTLGNLPESEPNQNVAEASPTTTFPSLRTGILHIADEDVFSLPAAASTRGPDPAAARLQRRPPAAHPGRERRVALRLGDGRQRRRGNDRPCPRVGRGLRTRRAPGRACGRRLPAGGPAPGDAPHGGGGDAFTGAVARPRSRPRPAHAGKGSPGRLAGQPTTRDGASSTGDACHPRVEPAYARKVFESLRLLRS